MDTLRLGQQNTMLDVVRQLRQMDQVLDRISSADVPNYEQGTWTPTALFSTSNGNRMYNSQVGRYTRIGNLVHIQGFLQFDETTASGNFSIGGLPFSANTTSANYAGGTLYADNLTGVSGQIMFLIGADVSDKSLFVYFSGTGTRTRITQAHTGTDTIFSFSICYQTT